MLLTLLFSRDLAAQSLESRLHMKQQILPGRDTSALRRILTLIPENHYTSNLTIVCRQEWKFEKVTGIPLRIRVGSLEQCNRLEGK